jgi:multiple sugar transport system substrate-binding protein
MKALTRRGFVALATTALASPALSRRALAETSKADIVTQNLPRTYAGRALNITWGSTPAYNQITAYCTRFTEATGIELKFVALQQADRYQKMILDAASNTNSFDVSITAYQWKDEVAPYFADLSNIDKEIKGVPPLALDDYPQLALDAYSRVGTKMVTIPILGDASMLIWDKKALTEAGLSADETPPTWDAVVERGTKLVGGQRYGFNMPAGKSIQTACVWITLFHGFGGSYFDARGAPTFDSPASLKATRFMAERLGKISPPGNLTWDFPEMINSLASGRSAQGYMWAGGLSTLFDPAKSTVATTLGFSPTPEAVLLGGWGLGINARGRNVEAAKLFVGWLTSAAVAREIALVSGSPCRTSTFHDPDVIAKYPGIPAVLKGMQGKVATYPPIKESEQLNIIIYDQVNAACAGTKTAEQAVADMQAGVTTFMRRRGYLKG